MKKILYFTILFFLASLIYAAGPRVWGKSGTATTTNATVTVGGTSIFYPASLCVENTGATNNLFIDWSDGVATATDNSTNILIGPGKSYCFNFDNPNVLNQMDIGLLAGAATTTYNLFAIARR